MAEHDLTVSFYLPDMAERSLTRLPTFTLHAADDMSVHALVERAATDFITAAEREETVQDIISSANIVFSRPQVTDDVLAAQQRDFMWGVRDDGSAVMANIEYSNVTVGEMLRAGEEGLLAGDPRHLVIAATGGRGAGISPKDIWDVFVVVIGLAKYGYEAAEMGRNTAEMRRGLSRRAAREYVKRWLENGFLPTELQRLIEQRSAWKTGDLEKFLRIIAEDAQTLLGDCGYRFDPDRGEWVRSNDPKTVVRRERHKRMLGYMLSGDPALTTQLTENDGDPRQEIEAEAERVDPDSDEPPVDGAGASSSGPVEG